MAIYKPPVPILSCISIFMAIAIVSIVISIVILQFVHSLDKIN